MSSVKAFFSGIESEQHFNACLDADVTHVLTSFFQFYKKGDPDVVKKRKLKHPHLKFMIDSGAHSFIAEYQKFLTWKRTDFDNYVEAYVKWLYDNRKYIFAAVELDIDYCLNMVLGGSPTSTIGSSIVEGWQKSLFAPLQKKGLDIIYVWHVERKLEGWEDMCARYAYVGLPGEMSSQSDFNKYMSVARRYTTKVHGFAATKQADFRDWPWYSVDSITWKTSEMYGTLIHWDDHKQLLKFVDDKALRVNYRAYFERAGLDADGIIRDTNYKEVTKYALWSMRQMEKYYEEKYKSRVFYYERRLPFPSVIQNRMKDARIERWWQKLAPDTLFKGHQFERDVNKLREHLTHLSAVQHGDDSLIRNNPKAEQFLGTYFPKLITPLVGDFRVLQKELAALLSPSNPPVLERTAPDQFEDTNNPPKTREAKVYTLEELIPRPVPDFLQF